MTTLCKRIHSLEILLISLITLLTLTGCARSTPAPSASCVPPPVKVAFPYLVFQEPGDALPADVLPPSEWEPQLSDDQSKRLHPFSSVDSIAARSSDEIWLLTSQDLVRYQPSTHELITYTVKVSEEGIFLPSLLFLGKDGTLWGRDHFGLSTSNRFCGVLSRYDAKNDRFEPVLDKDGILKDAPGSTRITEDAQGMLWLVIDNVVFSFDPATHQAKRALDEQQGYRFHNLVGAPDGTIWLSATPVGQPQSVEVVIRYDPRTGDLEYHGPPPEAEDNFGLDLYLDRTGRLWVDDYGWREVPSTGEPVWYRIIRSPVFITRIRGGEFTYSWVRPHEIYESSNGLFWFSSSAGLVKLDFQSGEWCLVTTLSSPVTEDDAHNLWVAGNGQIYKYHLQP